MLKTIITISGLARAGKDTFAELLKEEFVCMGLRPLQINNGDWLKTLAKRLYGEYSEQDKESYRKNLQELGTDIVREVKEDYWIETTINAFKVLTNEIDVGIIADARFKNEITGLHKYFNNIDDVQFFSIYVRSNRPSCLSEEAKKHKSEQLLEEMSLGEFSFCINNFYDIDELRNAANYVAKYVARVCFDYDNEVSDADCENYRWNE